MRVSCLKSDPGYPAWIQGGGYRRWRILLDGVEQRDVVTADDELGVVVRNRRDARGLIALNERRDAVIRDELRGLVRIVRAGEE